MESQVEEGDFSDVVETLTSMFGGVVNRDVIVTVVESCGGDLNVAAEAIMNISETCKMGDTAINPLQENQYQQNESSPQHQNIVNQPLENIAIQQEQNILLPQVSQSVEQPSQSYAGAFRSMGAVPKSPQNQTPLAQSRPQFWTNQLRYIITLHNQGARLLILMRGVPGSGKTYLAKQIVDILVGASYANYKTHILSADDYFIVRGVYQYDRSRVGEAHEWNRSRARFAAAQGLSPIIIDNTNIEIWEMEHYLRDGVRNGYKIEVVEPNTPWAKKAGQLARKNSHNVPLPKIKRMLENLIDGITGDFLIKRFGLSYPADMVPPVMRTRPAFHSNQFEMLSSDHTAKISELPSNTAINQNHEVNISYSGSNTNTRPAFYSNHIEMLSTNLSDHIAKISELPNTVINQNQEVNISYSGSNTNVSEEQTMKDNIDVEDEGEAELAIKKRYMEIEKQLEVFEQVEQEWENGEKWDDNISEETTSRSKTVVTSFTPKPPRQKITSETLSTDNTTEFKKSSDFVTLLENVKSCNDWRNISMFMPPWYDETGTEQSDNIDIPIETKSSATCIEIGDTDLKNTALKIIITKPRDINIFHMAIDKRKIPDKQMLDKSTMTNEQTIMDEFKCKNEEKHFLALRKLFKNVPESALRDVFDKCGGDVNWTVDIILEGIVSNQLEIVNNESISDGEDETQENQEQCNCMAAYNITPDMGQSVVKTVTQEKTADSNVQTPDSSNTSQKKTKITPSESSIQLKRQIEKNVVISDAHYSDHCLRIRKIRRGDSSSNEYGLNQCTSIQELNTPSSVSIDISRDDATPSTSKQGVTSSVDHDNSDDEESLASSTEEAEKTVNVYVGMDLVKQLDELFGRNGITYPEKVVPKLNLPISLLNEINAFWMESLMHQMDEMDKHNAAMLKEDEEFARQLSMKEEELAQQGKEPEIPDFKEIMDMDFALSLYQKDVAEWRRKEPNDMAAKLSREKLYNLFPDMSQDILSELLMAHDNNFQATVEVLLMSTGKEKILEDKNGLSKFVMEKEMERHEKLLEEERKALSEVEWPLLPKGEVVEMSMVNGYREEAEKHLASRNHNYNKAQEYIRRGMTQVANYYSDIAAFHKKKFEQANSMAAATLIQVHATNSPDNATIDLHYLRVAEAKESLDIFLDTHIQKLREMQKGRMFTLFLITGRGLHSGGRPRVKPAVKKRLRERGLVSVERNPGLLTTKVAADDKLAFEIANS